MTMTPTHSKSRRKAEMAFGKVQSQLRAVEERDSVVVAREEKTSRLREARLARETADAAALASKPARKV
jgi:hypothetical protein